MYARITRFQIKPAELDAADGMLQSMKASILALPGMEHFTLAVGDDGDGYVISLVESQETSEQEQEQIRAIWAQMTPYLEGPPEAPTLRKVLANWAN